MSVNNFRSMFFDEDGDLAHEFYVEEVPAEEGLKPKMIKVDKDLTPQVSL